MSAVRSVAIAGGGIGGLALANALARAGVDVTVLERAKQPSAKGSGLVLAPNGVKALAAIDSGLVDALREAGSVAGATGTSGHRSCFVTARGETLAEVSFDGFEASFGAPAVSVRRAALHAILLDGARAAGARIVHGATVAGVEDGAVSLSDGSTVEADVLVGADGLRSRVRAWLLDDGAPSYRGYSAVRGIGPAVDGYPHGFIAYGRGLIVFASPVDDEHVYWVASIVSPPEIWPAKDRERRRTDLLAAMDGWTPALRGLVEHSPIDEDVVTDVYDRRPTSRWHRGRTVLLGDAAHPMTYTMGQGANMALEDAAVLAPALLEGDALRGALAAYVAERAPRTARVVKQSRMFGTIGHAKGRLTAWFRDTMMRRMAGGDDSKANAALFGWMPPQIPRAAVTTTPAARTG